MAVALRLIDNDGLPARCRECPCRRDGFCASLAPGELAKLHPHLVRKKLPAGDAIMQQGEANSFYVHVLQGTVKLASELQDGMEQIVGLRYAGDFLGQRFTQEFGFTAEASSDVELCKVPKASLDALADSSTRVAHLMHRQVASELEETRGWMLSLAQRDARQKVASLLYGIARRQPASAGAVKFELPLSRAEIANYLGLTIETISRQFSLLKRDGIIRIERTTHITIDDMGALAASAGIHA